MRFGSFITTFDRPGTLQSTIESTLRQTRPPDLLLVVDNGSGPAAGHVVSQFPGVVYVPTRTNLGSAGGAALGMELLLEEGCDWIHLIDDDNPLDTTDSIERMIALIERHPETDVGAVAATGSRWDWTSGRTRRLHDQDLEGDLAIDIIGGSNQMTVSRKALEHVGPPSHDLFFGFWDGLYSLQLAQAGYSMWIEGDLMMEYRRANDRLNHSTVRTLRPRDPLHAVWRRYYVTRNYIHHMLRTFERPDLARAEAMRALARSVASWSRGPRYGKTYATLQVRGVRDGYRGRLGRTVEPVKKPTVTS